MNAVGDSKSRIAGQAVFILENTKRDLRDFSKIHQADLGKHNLQLCGSIAQQREAGTHDLPVFFGIARRRQRADIVQLFFKARNSAEPLDEIPDPELLLGRFQWKAATYVKGAGTAEIAFLRQQQIRKA